MKNSHFFLLIFAIFISVGFITSSAYLTRSSINTDSHASGRFSIFNPLGKSTRNVLNVESVREVGAVGKPQNVSTRDGGISVKFGDTIAWIFNDTLFNPKSADGANARSNTVAFANISTPLAVEESLDAQGAPYQFIEINSDNKNYNIQKNKGDDRYALWPMSAVNSSDSEVLIFSLDLKVQQGNLNYDLLGVNIDKLEKGSSVTTSIATHIFKKPESLFVRSALIDKNYLYLYSCDKTKFGCEIARVAKNKVSERTAYNFWNGRRWDKNINNAKKVIDASSSGFSVEWNGYLNKFVAIYSKPFANKVLARTASRPEGPWSSQKTLFTGLAPVAGSFNYAAQQHPVLFKSGGKQIYVSYYQPLGPFTGELRLVEVTLK